MRVAIIGASGFVGSAVSSVLEGSGHEVVKVRAPRVSSSSPELLISDSLNALDTVFGEVDAVVNCSGNPDASAGDESVLLAANAVSPALVARAAMAANVRRLVHVSSAVVQGRRPILDETMDTEEFSAYSRSKAEGERRVMDEFPDAVVYRPPSVHSVNRRVTRLTAKIAGSPFASVAAPGDRPSPQTLIANVASAIAFLATTEQKPPSIVIHPWEGLTTSSLMESLGGKRPVLLPRTAATAVVKVLRAVGSRAPSVSANARRVEMLWFGQGQAESWLTGAGWECDEGLEAWRVLGESVRKVK